MKECEGASFWAEGAAVEAGGASRCMFAMGASILGARGVMEV